MMKKLKYNYPVIALIISFFAFLFIQCERDFDELERASFPTTGEVFIDGFSAGLQYEAWGDVTAFDVDFETKYKGSASMKFAVPDEGQTGGYAGGRYVTSIPRDLSGYDALTFWAKASKPASIDEIGFGNNAQGSVYQSMIRGVKLNTNWKKIIIPIADPSKLTSESGMLFYAEPPEDGSGYTFWIDEVQFEKLGTIAHPQPAILEAQDQSIAAETGDILTLGGTFSIFNMPDGTNQRVEVAPGYFNFTSTDPSVASIGEDGRILVGNVGTAMVTAKLGSTDAKGSIEVESLGTFPGPEVSAPLPTMSADSVISLFSNAYTDVTVDTWNPFWEFSTAEVRDKQIAGGDDVKLYRNLNFVGIEFTSQTINASEMTHFHLDIWTPGPVEGARFAITLVDFGPDNGFGGGDDSSIEFAISEPILTAENWIGIDVPLNGLASRANMAQLVLACSGNPGFTSVYIDNAYFYMGEDNGGGGIIPNVAAPAPTQPATDVISIYGDAYTNLEGTDYPNWGQTTLVSDFPVQGNNVLKFANFNFQGIQLTGSIDVTGMTSLHLDYWAANSTDLNVYLISPGPVEKAYALTVPTSGWVSVDIPLSAFAPVDLTDVFQLKFDGNGEIYIDNIFFHKGSGGGGGGAPTPPNQAAPAPAEAAEDVISIFSDAYTNLEGTDYPDWGQTTLVSDYPVEENNTLKFSNFNYQGVQLAGSLDVSGMTSLHLDYWTTNSTDLNIYLISPGPVETAYALTVPTSGWGSVDIPLSSFSPVDLTDIIQLKFDGNGEIYIDNLYFHK